MAFEKPGSLPLADSTSRRHPDPSPTATREFATETEVLEKEVSIKTVNNLLLQGVTQKGTGCLADGAP